MIIYTVNSYTLSLFSFNYYSLYTKISQFLSFRFPLISLSMSLSNSLSAHGGYSFHELPDNGTS